MKKPELKDMTLREKIAQTMLVRQREIYFKNVDGQWIERTDEELYEMMDKNQFGGLWVLGNFKLDFEGLMETNEIKKPHSDEYKAWIEKISQALKIPILVGLDAARGAGMFSNTTRTCGALSIGATDDLDLAYDLTNAIAKELRACGANWHWYPVADVPGRFKNRGRVVSEDPEKIISFSKVMAKALSDENVASTVKHFPGKDPYETRDSHIVTSEMSLSLPEWWETQGRVFQEIIDSGVYSVMVGHKVFAAVDDGKIDGKGIPSTLSKKVITDLLKGEMGFKGVVVTDSIGMGGVQGYFSRDQLLVELLKAGNDVILGANINCVDVVEKAVLSGELSEERIDDACQRVLDMKEKIGMFEDDYQIGTDFTEEMQANTLRINREVSDRSITLVRDRANLLPLSKDKIKKVAIVVSTHRDFIMNSIEVTKKEFEKRGATVHVQRRIKSKNEMAELAENYDLILYATYLATHAPKGAVSFYDDEFDTFMHALSFGREKSIGMSMGDPFIHYNFLANINTFVNLYSYSREVQESFVAGLYGEMPFKGVSPVALTPRN